MLTGRPGDEEGNAFGSVGQENGNLGWIGRAAPGQAPLLRVRVARAVGARQSPYPLSWR